LGFVDKYYDAYRAAFKFDPACCLALPDADETIFHFRNFLHEMPKKGIQYGFAELGPNQTARDLFAHLNAGDKVAIITRFDATFAQPYVDALERKGLQVRVVTGQTGVQDLCFLKSAEKEIVGSSVSTYFLWAGILGNAATVRVYSIDSEERRNRKNPEGFFVHYNFTRQDVQNRFKFELHRVDKDLDPLDWRRRLQLAGKLGHTTSDTSFE
jgi:hypothetical protein